MINRYPAMNSHQKSGTYRAEHPRGRRRWSHLTMGISLSNPDVWHLTNIIQGTLDWEQNECRERGSSFNWKHHREQPSKKAGNSAQAWFYVTAFSELLACSPNTRTHTYKPPPWASFPVLALPFLFKAFGKILFHFTLTPVSLEGAAEGSQNSRIWIGIHFLNPHFPNGHFLF